MLHPLLRATSCVNLALDRGVGNEFKLGQEPPYDYAAVSSANPIRLWIVIHAPACSPPPGSGSSEDGSVVIMPAAATILPGQSQQFVAQVSGLSDKTVTGAVANVGGRSIALGFTPRRWTDDDGTWLPITATQGVPGVFGSAFVKLPSVTLSIAPGAIAVGPGLSQAFTNRSGLAEPRTGRSKVAEGARSLAMAYTRLLRRPASIR